MRLYSILFLLLASSPSFSQNSLQVVTPDSLSTVRISGFDVYPANLGDSVKYDSAAVMRVEAYRRIRWFLLSFPDYQKDIKSSLSEAEALLAQCDTIRSGLRKEIQLIQRERDVFAKHNSKLQAQNDELLEELKKPPPFWERLKKWLFGLGGLALGVAAF